MSVHICVPGALKEREMLSDPMELEFQTAVGYHDLGSVEEQPVLSTTEPSLQPGFTLNYALSLKKLLVSFSYLKF